MSSNEQYPYYYGSNSGSQIAQNNYSNYQSRTNQYSQNTRRASSSTPAQTYSYQQQSYGNGQAQQYEDQGYYGNARDGGQTAAETLSRMSSAATYPSSTTTAYNQTHEANTYNSNFTHPQNTSFPSSATVQHQNTNYHTQSSYGATQNQQARPSSVNAVRNAAISNRSPVPESVQMSHASGNGQHSRKKRSTEIQRSASPAQIQASRQLQRLADQRSHEMAQSASHSTQQTFVDPSAVYDPWPEYQRKLAAAKAAKEAEDRAAAERAATEQRETEEEAKRQEEEKRQKVDEEKADKKVEAARMRAEAKKAGTASKRKRKSKAVAVADEAAGGATISGMNLQQLTSMANAAPSGSDAEAQIRQLMSMVKQMNDKHPDLLAKIWEEERQQHLEKANIDTLASAQATTEEAPKAQAKKKLKKSAPRKAAVATVANSDAEPFAASHLQSDGTKAQANVVPLSGSSTSTITGATPPPAQTKPATQKANNAARGTIWPPEKKDQIAVAAVRWLSGLPDNQGRSLTAPQVASMLDKNPTYIELCEMIERQGLKVERAAFAKALLSSVPDVNANRSAASPAVPRPPSTGPLRAPVASTLSQPATPTLGVEDVNNSLVQNPAASQPLDTAKESRAYESPYFDSQGQQIPSSKPPKAGTSKPKADSKASESKKPDAMGAGSSRPSQTLLHTTKAEAARKRTFADLVDLTALSDDENQPPMKQSYYGPPAIIRPGQAYSTQLDFLPDFHGIVDPHLQRSVDRYSRHAPPSFEEQQVVSITHKLNTVELAKPVEKKNAARRLRYDIRTLARDVLLATGKHPDLLPLNGHLEPLRNVFTNSIHFNSDLSTVRWDLIDPGEPVPEALAGIINDDKDSVIDDADDESEEEVRQFTIRASSHSQFAAAGTGDVAWAGRTVGTSSRSTRGVGHGKVVPTRGRGRPRGRPPGVAKFSTGGAQQPVGNHPGPGIATVTGTPDGGGTGHASLPRGLRPDGTKKRGRPVGWRKNIHGRAGLGYNSTSQGIKSVDTTPAPEPKFTVYTCKWKDCAAQLHNLDTLRRHIQKKHGEPDVKGKFTCLWMACGRKVQNNRNDGEVNEITHHYDYPDTTELMRHVEQAHITPIAWELGDGPPGGFSDSNASDAEAYLSDRQGRRVTPTILAAAPASAPSSAPRSGQRGRPPKKTDEQKARESQANIARRKRDIGLGVDKEGATFANEKRRAGFVDDEDGDEVLVDTSD